MKVLLLHPEDSFPLSRPAAKWDLVVDFARAPQATYERWSKLAGCRFISLYDFAEEVEDLYRLREMFRLGRGQVVDRLGIDWWDVLSLEVVFEALHLMLVRRLAKELPEGSELFVSRPHSSAALLANLSGSRVVSTEARWRARIRGVRHYQEALARLDRVQVLQILQDKFDSRHAIRRRLRFRAGSTGKPVVLLPSAYVNTSRAAVSYAAMLPELQFLLVCARDSGRLKQLPSNTVLASLDPYFGPGDEREIASLREYWRSAKEKIIAGAEEFRMAEEVGVLERLAGLLTWGIVIRDAWSRLFEAEDITACLCADDNNPYSRVPLILASLRGLPTLACHHGALDWTAILKTPHADFQLAKGQMERDYLLRVCGLAPERVVMGAPATGSVMGDSPASGEAAKPWLVFFTEPYQSLGWRSDEVYRDLLPRLAELACNCGLKLILKLHPFDSLKGHRQMVRRYLAGEPAGQVELVTGPPTAELWRNTRFAVTVQSTAALECTARGIPVFLMAWLRDLHSGYVRQYGRFAAGQRLESAGQISEIPSMLEAAGSPAPRSLWEPMEPEKLRGLITGACSLPVRERAIRAGR